MFGTMNMNGKVGSKVLWATSKAPLSWRIRNTLTWIYIYGWLGTSLAKWFSKIFGVMTVTSELRAVRIDPQGHRVEYGVVSRRVVTTTGCGFITDAWRNTTELENMKYHGCGTGSGAEAAADTALVTECTTALNPDSIRATGSLAGSGLTFQTVGTQTFDSAAAVIEHGILSQAATGGGVLLDRSVFSAINVASGDSIQWTYTLTLTAGG